MQFFNEMMTEIKIMKMEHSEQISQLDDDIWDYIFKNVHARNDNNNRSRMKVHLRATQNQTVNSKICSISMICVNSNAHQCDKHIVCHTGMKWASCLFHFFSFLIKIKTFLACIPLFL